MTQSAYFQTYANWQSDPEGFWSQAAQGIDWTHPWDQVFDPNAGVYGRWFPGAFANTCYNAVDRHVENGHGDHTALIYDSPITDQKRNYSFSQLQHHVSQMSQILLDRGVTKGDRVIIYMPMIPEAAFAMLACARIGAVHSVVFGGFAATELASRITDAGANLVIAASCGIEPSRVVAYKPILDEAIELCNNSEITTLVVQRPQDRATLIEGRDFDYASLCEQMSDDQRLVPCVDVAATDPLYILYTSGTTGTPKGVVRDTGGHMVALKWSMEHFYGLKPGEVFWAASDVGWVVGHSYSVYGPLLHGCATVIFEGKPVGTPDAGTFWRVIAEHKVAALFVAPTALRVIRKEDPEGEFIKANDLSDFRTLFVAGEKSDTSTVEWARNALKRPVIDHWWQTETGWCIAGNPVGLGALPIKDGSQTVPMPGYHIDILSDEGEVVPPNTLGNIAIRLPLPPSSMPTLWNNDARFSESYLDEFPGYYATSDAGTKDEDGYIFVMARTDDIINVAGHRLSTGAMENVISQHPDVAECAVIGVKDPIKGEVPQAFVVLKNDTNNADVIGQVVTLVRTRIGPVASLKQVYLTPGLPKSRSGKLLRKVIRQVANNEPCVVPAVIEDPSIIDTISKIVAPDPVA